MMLRFSRPRLITFDDPAYRAHVEEMKLQRANQRALRPPSQRDLFGGEAEKIVRSALVDLHTLSPRRILDYNERIGQRWYRKFRELDAVVVEERRVHLFEIKASRRARALHRAVRQVRDSHEILQLLFHTVASTLIFVDTGVISAEERDTLMLGPDAPQQPPQTLQEAIDDYPDLHRVASLADIGAFSDHPQIVIMTVDHIVNLAGDAALSLAWAEEEAEDRQHEAPPESKAPVYTSAAEAEEEDNPFAAAFRKATQQTRSKQ